MATLLFYVSGHGYGHARRMTQVIREFLTCSPGATVYIRSAAPARVFEPLAAWRVESSEIDAGLVEVDPLTIDRDGSLRRLTAFMARRDAIVAEEVTAARRLKPSLIVADIPFLAGDVASQLGVPCVGISNFTWDWIYAHLFAGDPAYSALGDSIDKSYARFTAMLELPFGRTNSSIPRKISMPLIAMRSQREPGEILRQIGISPEDGRPRVLVGTRGILPPGALARAACDAAEFLFLCPHETANSLPPNGVSVALGSGLDFSDVLSICDVLVSKLGYGIVSECIATQTPMVWPPREGFVEDEVMQAEAPKFVPMVPMSVRDYREGNWGDSLRRAMRLRPTGKRFGTNGAQECAEYLALWVEENRCSGRSDDICG